MGRPRQSRRKRNPLTDWWGSSTLRRGLTADDLVDRLNVSRTTVYAILEGSRIPSVIVANRIDRLTGGRVRALDWGE